MKIPDNTEISSVTLRVNDIVKTKAFYSEMLGLTAAETNGGEVNLFSGKSNEALLTLIEDREAPVRIKGSPGLFHVAFRFKNKRDLGATFLKMFNNNLKFTGFSDHIVSKAIYMNDPEGNGIEMYVDEPRDTWQWRNGQIVMDTLPLDLSLLTKELQDPEEISEHPEIEIGHIHLNVSNLFKAEKVYGHVLGFNITNSQYPGALFMSAGGYHHHLGLNTWQANSRLSRNNAARGLVNFEIKFPVDGYVAEIEDSLKKSDLLIKEFDGKSLEMRDYDGIGITIST